MSVQILGHGLYRFSEAARLTGLSIPRVRAWFTGGGLPRGELIHSDYADRDMPGLVSFLDLIDVLIVGRLRTTGVSLQYLRKVHTRLIREFRTPHPFCRKALFTDGRQVFIRFATEVGERKLKELLSQQQAFPSILLPFLQEIEYDPDTMFAKAWRIHEGVTIDPERKFGKPVLDSCRIPTAILAAAYRANDKDVRGVADWYLVPPEEVTRAVDFEDWLFSRKVA